MQYIIYFILLHFTFIRIESILVVCCCGLSQSLLSNWSYCFHAGRSRPSLLSSYAVGTDRLMHDRWSPCFTLQGGKLAVLARASCYWKIVSIRATWLQHPHVWRSSISLQLFVNLLRKTNRTVPRQPSQHFLSWCVQIPYHCLSGRSRRGDRDSSPTSLNFLVNGELFLILFIFILILLHKLIPDAV
jgi:hypothetical protein